MIAAAVIVHEGRVLMTKCRFKEESFVWGSPAGKCEPGKTPEQPRERDPGDQQPHPPSHRPSSGTSRFSARRQAWHTCPGPITGTP
ncbi:MAG TPA: NUDIX domain-containing protein [Candidatus Dormibacteraeota bacterium]|nr:NUDIX domain-containing protein [Candidatus Dormibacteraeota bacterium]